MKKKTQKELKDKLLKEITDRYELSTNELKKIKELIKKKEYKAIINNYKLEGVRVCSECGKLMDEGFCICDGCAYYCGETCLRKNYKGKERKELGIGDDWSDSYWTEWYY